MDRNKPQDIEKKVFYLINGQWLSEETVVSCAASRNRWLRSFRQ
jgi:hypothetical protein